MFWNPQVSQRALVGDIKSGASAILTIKRHRITRVVRCAGACPCQESTTRSYTKHGFYRIGNRSHLNTLSNHKNLFTRIYFFTNVMCNTVTYTSRTHLFVFLRKLKRDGNKYITFEITKCHFTII